MLMENFESIKCILELLIYFITYDGSYSDSLFYQESRYQHRIVLLVFFLFHLMPNPPYQSRGLYSKQLVKSTSLALKDCSISQVIL